MIFMSQMKKGKDEKWREINITELAGCLVSFGELRLSTITAWSLPRNPELAKRKTRLLRPLFLLAFTFPHFLSPATTLSLCSVSLSPFLFVPLWFVPPTVCYPEGVFKAVLIHLQAPARPHRAALRDSFGLFGVKVNFTVGVNLD